MPNSHQKQFKRYIRDSEERVSCILVIVPEVQSVAEENAARLKFESGSDTDVSIITAEDLRYVREQLGKLGKQTPLIAKIETAMALTNIGEILDETDGVLLARGDLALETPFEQVPIVQKQIIKEAHRRGKPVITATQMLMSMVKAFRPTRAEVNDVANAVLDGSDAVMLSEETAVGDHPAVVIEVMAKIASNAARSVKTQPMNGW